MSLHSPNKTHSREIGKRTALLTAFGEFLPEDAILFESEDLHPYECDGLSAYRQLPMIAVLPRTVDEVQRIMRAISLVRKKLYREQSSRYRLSVS